MMSSEQVRKYFAIRLARTFDGGRLQIVSKCPFHDDKTASLSVNLEKGLWQCFAGCGSGSVLDFEQRFLHCDRDAAVGSVNELLGNAQMFTQRAQPEAIYKYQNAQAAVVFEKLRYPGKRFVQRRDNGRGGYEYKLQDGAKPLYHLPEVLRANEIIVCEGEKDVERVRAANLAGNRKDVAVAVTCNFDGAGRWRDEYAVYFAGKKAIVFADNDDIGRRHAQHVARSVAQYAIGVKVVELPGLKEHGDVSDYLDSHSTAELLAHVERVKQWQAPAADDRVLVPVQQFVTTATVEVDWLLEGIIERGANGLIIAKPKVGKSWIAADLALALAAGRPWLDFPVPRPVRVALVSREDNPPLTGWRLRHLAAPRRDLDTATLLVNTRSQTADFKLGNHDLLNEMIDAFKLHSIEFAIFDVFNVLHDADENDNTEMRSVLDKLSSIQKATGASIALVHHIGKNDNGALVNRARGASSIFGWCEFTMALDIADATTKVRKIEFELKAAYPPEPVYFEIASDEEGASLRRTIAPDNDNNNTSGIFKKRQVN